VNQSKGTKGEGGYPIFEMRQGPPLGGGRRSEPPRKEGAAHGVRTFFRKKAVRNGVQREPR